MAQRQCLTVLAGLAVWLFAAGAYAQPATKKHSRRPPPSAEQPGAPTEYRSAHFLVHTDLPSKEARELLKRLETMIDLISKYWGRPPSGVIECFVVKDLQNWVGEPLHPDALPKIQEGAGVTFTQTATAGGKRLSVAVVYAVADHGTPQHEAVHAYCGQTFGTCGPLWYAEGMAEMGHYWRQGDSAVHIEPVVLQYLKSAEPQSINEIVNSKSITGDSWRNYAWRWALCHLLANNTNYRDRFRPLGLGFLTEQKVSFEETYGSMSHEISFEYRFFIKHLEQGFRADLCSWDWKKRFKPLIGSTIISAPVAAGRGWQATGVTCAAGQQYDYAASGAWRTGKDGPEVSADGDAKSLGRLCGALMHDFKLSEPFELGSYGSFTAPGDGKLYLRCQDGWSELADNRGTVTVKLKLAGKGAPLARPKESTGTAASPASSAPGKNSPGDSKPKPAPEGPAPGKPAPGEREP